MTSAYLDKLNDRQREAVEHGVGLPDAGIGGPLLIIAGAGSGKTNTLAHRVAHLIVHGADPRRILLMTFSRRAAAEMGRRVERICRQVLGENAAILTDALAWSGTFHGIGARLIRIYAEQIGLNVDFTIHDREDSADLMNIVRHDLGFSKTQNRFPTKGTCLAIYSRVVNSESSISEVLKSAFPWVLEWESELKQLFAGYVEAKQAQNVLDYDDLLLYWAQMVSDPDIADDVGSRFDHVLVDEYQDTNRLQSSILMALKPGGRGLTVVGDDAQSIYSFRAATIRNILDFPHAFSPKSADVITLDRNYRSTAPILAAANGVIDLAASALPRTSGPTGNPNSARSGDGEGRDGTGRLYRRAGAGQSRGWCAAQAAGRAIPGLQPQRPAGSGTDRRNIPFVKFGGLKFLDSAHVKDMLAVLRFAQNPRDRVAGFRLLQMLPGIGPQTAARILDTIAADPEPLLSLMELLPRQRAARTGRASPRCFPLCANPRRAGPRRSGWPVPGMSRISIAFMRMRTRGRPIFFSSSRLPQAMPVASDS